jgi:hypothetical protein
MSLEIVREEKRGGKMAMACRKFKRYINTYIYTYIYGPYIYILTVHIHISTIVYVVHIHISTIVCGVYT